MFIFLFCLIIYFIPSFLFQYDTTYYNELTLPNWAPPAITFPIVWTILYLLLAFYTTIIIKRRSKTLYFLLILNYILNISFSPIFFCEKQLYLSALITVGCFSTGLVLYFETKRMHEKLAYLLIPYLMWTFFASILAISIFLLN